MVPFNLFSLISVVAVKSFEEGFTVREVDVDLVDVTVVKIENQRFSLDMMPNKELILQ